MRSTSGFSLIPEHDRAAEAAQSAADPARRDEHARQAYWRCQAAVTEATGLVEYAEALADAFDAPDPARNPTSRWFSRS